MIQIKFKNLEKSELAREAAQERMENLIEKFPDLGEGHVQVTLEMENSPTQAGPDLFKVKVFVSKSKYDGALVEKSNSNLYVALADVVDHMLETLNRYGDKERVKQRRSARQIAQEVAQELGKKMNNDEQKYG